MDQLFTDYTLRTVALGAALLGAVSGTLGTFAVLRKQSLLGDAISHAALPGIGLAFLLTGSKIPLVLMIGAALAGWCATALVMAITGVTRVKYDSALGLVLSVFFGVGLVILTVIQKMPNANQAGLDAFLFGQAAALVEQDVLTMAGLGGVALLLAALFWKEFQLLAFNVDFGRSLGLPMRRLDILLTALLVIAIVIGLQTVGVVLMSAMIVAPAAAARQWTDRLGKMVLLAMGFGALAGVVGALISTSTAHLPTGPTIVLTISGIVAFSMLFAPRRGLILRAVRHRLSNTRFKREAVLLDLYQLAQQHATFEHPHPEATLMAMQPGSGSLRAQFKVLADQGLIRPAGKHEWALTLQGMAECERLRRERNQP